MILGGRNITQGSGFQSVLRGSQGIRGYVSVMAALKSTYFWNYKDMVLSKIIVELLRLAMRFFPPWTLEYLIKKHPVPTKRETIILMKVKSRNALLRVLVVGISIYLKLVLRYTFIILDSYRPDVLYLCEWGSVVIFRNQKRSASKEVWETLTQGTWLQIFVVKQFVAF